MEHVYLWMLDEFQLEVNLWVLKQPKPLKAPGTPAIPTLNHPPGHGPSNLRRRGKQSFPSRTDVNKRSLWPAVNQTSDRITSHTEPVIRSSLRTPVQTSNPDV